jgi:hypothetical protein
MSDLQNIGMPGKAGADFKRFYCRMTDSGGKSESEMIRPQTVVRFHARDSQRRRSHSRAE